MERKSLYDPVVYDATINRLNNLDGESAPQWGKMDTAQMMAHCSAILDVSNGKPLKNTPFFARVFKGMIKKMVVGPKPYPKNSKTHPQYVQSTPKDFAQEKQRLLDTLQKFREMEGEKTVHSLFGEFTPDEKGWAQYKHLDHHLTQFGV